MSGQTNREHVPPLQFFPREARKKLNPQLDTLEVHTACNTAYKHDEEYFAYSVGALAGETAAGGALWRDQSRRFKEDRLKDLAMKALGEFVRRPGDPEPPEGMALKRVDRKRASRVVWKIVKGLYTLNRNEVLPDETDKIIEMAEPGRELPPEYKYVLAQKSQGRYMGVFDYKSVVVGGEKLKVEMWALLFWDCVIAFATFHALNCTCPECSSERKPT